MGDDRIVLNASPLILLTKIDGTSLLKEITSEVVVPAAVRKEVEAHEKRREAFQALFAGGWIDIAPDLPLSQEIVEWDLGAGESQVLAFASANPGWEAALDDLDARRCASALGIPLTGTLGLILRAKEAGAIPAARPLLERLVTEGAHLSDGLLEEALALVGERWREGT